MQGIDAQFDGVVFVGYHAGTTNPDGVRAHTFSSATLADVRLNGVTVNEGVWNAALAGHFGVPVLAVSGDEAAVKEVAAQVLGVETAGGQVAARLPCRAHAHSGRRAEGHPEGLCAAAWSGAASGGPTR